MPIDLVTIGLLGSTLGSEAVRNMFKSLVRKRIAERSTLRAVDDDADRKLAALVEADLISAAPGDRYFVTAKGLKVARDLEKIPG